VLKSSQGLPKSNKKLSYKEQKELNELPKKIEMLEADQAELQQHIASAEFYKQDAETIANTMAKLKQFEEELGKLYQRWEVLDGLGKK
jgi:ABC transport system ATP-binding/permease protein